MSESGVLLLPDTKGLIINFFHFCVQKAFFIVKKIPQKATWQQFG
jgi:hypothetical protein